MQCDELGQAKRRQSRSRWKWRSNPIGFPSQSWDHGSFVYTAPFSPLINTRRSKNGSLVSSWRHTELYAQRRKSFCRFPAALILSREHIPVKDSLVPWYEATSASSWCIIPRRRRPQRIGPASRACSYQAAVRIYRSLDWLNDSTSPVEASFGSKSDPKNQRQTPEPPHPKVFGSR